MDTAEDAIFLAEKLKRARCWRSEHVGATLSSRWFDLSQYDVEKAADLLRILAKEKQRDGRTPA